MSYAVWWIMHDEQAVKNVEASDLETAVCSKNSKQILLFQGVV
jgi:hypothetical protein